jgi:hypothetical protein
MRLVMSQHQNKPWTLFKIGNKVWLDNRNLPMPYATQKLNQRREEPFTITQKTSPTTYELKLPDKWCIHNRFHTSLLIPVIQNDIYGKHDSQLPPILISREEEYKLLYVVAWVISKHLAETTTADIVNLPCLDTLPNIVPEILIRDLLTGNYPQMLYSWSMPPSLQGNITLLPSPSPSPLPQAPVIPLTPPEHHHHSHHLFQHDKFSL